jgi:hypothetical protein
VVNEAHAGQPVLLIDQFLPRYDLAIVHAEVLRAAPDVSYRAARSVDLLRAPIIRALLELRTVPQRLTDRLSGRRAGTDPTSSLPTFRLDDMVRPPINWRLLGEQPGVELVLGQIGRPWQPTEMGSGPEVAPREFAAFAGPGFAKIALSLRVQPYGTSGTILTLETRVALTDAASLRRFRRYWRLIGPFSHLVRWLALRQLVADLGSATRVRPAGSGVGPTVRGLLRRLDATTQGIGRSVDYTGHVAYRRPPALYRHLQGFGVWVVSRGLVPDTVVVLEVRGRRSGAPRRTVVVRTPYAGQQYLVGLAGESEWVRNVRAAAGRAIIRHGRARRVVLEEVPLAERAPILWAYLHRPGWSSPAQEARHYFGLPPDAAVEDFRLIAERYPVFRVTTPPGETPAREKDAHANHR